jgi:hypothetical protein
VKRAQSPAVLAGSLVVLLAAAGAALAQDRTPVRTYTPAGNAPYDMYGKPEPEIHGNPDLQYSPYWDGAMTADCGFGCPPTWRVRAEALLLNREGNSGVSLSNAFRMDEFDFTEGGRFSLARKYDCALGWELVYTGLFEWEEVEQAAAAGALNTSLFGNGVNLTAFNNANLHQQLYRSELQSVELLQKWWGWDVLTTMTGFRYFNFEEEFAFRSVDGGGNVGLLGIETDNHLVGAELGVELFVPIGRFSFDNTLKGGLFANVGDSTTFLSNAGVVQVNNSDQDVEFAAMIEYGLYLRFNITPRLSVRAGYELLWIYGLGVAVEQWVNPVTPLTGDSFDGNADIFFHGGVLGAEFIW